MALKKAKQKPHEGFRLPFTTDALSFDLVCPFSLTDSAARLKKLGAAHPSLEIIFVQVDPETQRFHLTTRAFRAHLLEAQGHLKRVSPTATQVEGHVFSDTIAAPLFVTSLLVIAAGVLFFMTLWSFLLGALATWLLGMYCNYLVQKTHHDQHLLVKQIEAAIAPEK